MQRSDRMPGEFQRFRSVDLRIGEELPGLRVEENRVRTDAVCRENLLQFGPDWFVSAFVLGFCAGMNLHDESFADHGGKNEI